MSTNRNNFDLMRHAAAVAVLASHAVPITTGGNDGELVWRLTHQQATLGHLAVAVFFIISGTLITASFQRSRDPVQFMLARGLRLLPGLAVVLLVLAFIAGPMLTTLPLRDYLASPAVARFVGVNLSLTGFTEGLPGVLAAAPFPGTLDGSLWTLTYEARCYAAVLVLGMAGLLTRWPVTVLFAALLWACRKWWGGVGVEFYLYFAAGAMMRLWTPPLRAWLAAACIPPLIAAAMVGGLRLACATAGAYLVIYAATALRPVRVPLLGRVDLSYGLYVWAFPVQQAAVLAFGVGLAWWGNVLIALPVTAGLAWLSWHLVEAPALALCHQGGIKPRPAGLKAG